MTLQIVQIGNSKGIRIPKAILEQCKIGSHVDLHVERGKIILSVAKQVRKGWAEAAQRMHAAQDDHLLIPAILDGETTLPWE